MNKLEYIGYIISSVGIFASLISVLAANKLMNPKAIKTATTVIFISLLAVFCTIMLGTCNEIGETRKINKLVGSDIKAKAIDKKLKSMTSDTIITYRLPINSLVEKLEGAHYVIDLQDSYKKDSLQFLSGQYEIDVFDKHFGLSISRFSSIVDSIIEAGFDYRIYILGKADILGANSFKGVQKNYVYDTIWVHRKKDDGSFLYDKIPVSIPKTYSNEHLPNLRAAFMETKLHGYGINYKTEILTGEVVPLAGCHFRNVTIILYVNWLKK